MLWTAAMHRFFSPVVGAIFMIITVIIIKGFLFTDIPKLSKLPEFKIYIDDPKALDNYESLNSTYKIISDFSAKMEMYFGSYFDSFGWLLSLTSGVLMGILTGTACAFLTMIIKLEQLGPVPTAMAKLEDLPNEFSRLSEKFDSLENQHNIIAYTPTKKNRFINVYKYDIGELPELKVTNLAEKLNVNKCVVISYLMEDNFENLLLSDGYISNFVAAAGDFEGDNSRIQQNRIIVTEKDDEDIGLRIFSQLSGALKYSTVIISAGNLSKVVNYFVRQMKEDGEFLNQFADLNEWKVEDFYIYISGKANIATNTDNIFSKARDGRWIGGGDAEVGRSLLGEQIKFYIEWLNQSPKKVEHGGFYGDKLNPIVVFSFIFGRLLLYRGQNLINDNKSETYFLKPFEFQFDPVVSGGPDIDALERSYWDEIYDELSRDMIQIMSKEKP